MRGDVGIAPYDRFYQSDKLQFELQKMPPEGVLPGGIVMRFQ